LVHLLRREPGEKKDRASVVVVVALVALGTQEIEEEERTL